MAISRRQWLAVAGSGSALVLAGGFWRVTRMPETAAAPWRLDAKHPADVRLDAFRHAILAPNPHNRQPWLIRLVGTDQALVYCDPVKRLPETDPFDRQITVGFGTFLELARIAAAGRGVRMEIEPFPDGEPQPRLDGRPVASLSFSGGGVVPDPLFGAITARRTNRLVYEGGPSSQQLETLRGEGAAANADPALLAKLRPITIAAIAREMTTHAKHMESVRLMRIGHEEVDASPDGLALTGPMIEATALAGLTTRESLADPASTSFRIGLEDLEKTYGSVPAALWIVTPGNTRADQLEAGRRYVRANLRATALGLAMHPMSQALQEYPEMADQFAALRALLGVSGDATVQMLARVGRAPSVPPSARWPLEKHLLA